MLLDNNDDQPFFPSDAPNRPKPHVDNDGSKTAQTCKSLATYSRSPSVRTVPLNRIVLQLAKLNAVSRTCSTDKIDASAGEAAMKCAVQAGPTWATSYYFHSIAVDFI
jgi:hypothetical protein